MKCIDEDIPFEIPSSWCWVRLDDICLYIQRGKSPIYSEIKKYPVVAQKCNQWSGFSLEKALFVAPDSISKYGDERLLQQDDLLWNSTGLGTLGRMAIYDASKNPYNWAVADSHVTVIRPVKCFVVSLFLYYYFASPTVQSVIEDKADGSTKQKELSTNTIKTYIVPLPPLAEQSRIINKISVLLPIIERYGKTQNALDILNIEIKERLKKSILQEAIQGKLVEQLDYEEPASKLLERIRQEKQLLLKQSKLKAKDVTDSVIIKGDDNKYYEKCEKATSCIDTEIPFDIPDNWNWCRLGDLIYTKTGLAYSKPNLDIKSKKMIRVLRGGNMGYGFWNMKSDDVMISSEFVKSDLYLRKGYFITPAVTSWENMGKTALVREDYNDVVVGGFVLMMCPYYTNGIIEEYLNCFFQSVLFQQYCRSITNKSGQAFYNLSRNKLLQLLIPIPPIEEQKRIVDKINNATASIMSR